MDKEYKYDIAISFAEEDRNAALAIALALELYGHKRVYYYPDRITETIGLKANEILTRIYATEARYCIVLFSKFYFKKTLAQVEFAAIMNRIKGAAGERVMIPVLLPPYKTDYYRDLQEIVFIKWQYDPKSIVKHISDLLENKKDEQSGKQPDEKMMMNILNELSVVNNAKTDNQNNAITVNYHGHE